MTERKTPTQAAAGWYLFLRDYPDDEDMKHRFAEWLASDPAHARAWEDMNVTASVMAGVPRILHMPARTSATPVLHMNAYRVARRFLPGCALALAAACAALAFMPPDMLVRLSADHYAPVAQTRDIRLADGSEIILAPRAAVSLTINGSERGVRLLQGEALFDVRHDPTRPFRVTAGHVTATDVGTVFDVRMDGDATTVAVREGEVHVASARSGIIERNLHAGEWERVSGTTATAGTAPAATIGAWRDGTLIARDQTVAALITALRPWTAAKIVLTDSELAKKRVTGTYDLRQPEASLRLIVEAYGGQVSSLSSWIDIVRAR
ncbi:FecR domain-containing protein [Acetobacter fabarum]|uniref:FecR family protein n=1 Tax=Acetobacter fabarum TaxID=483199 RepID=UPI00312BC8BB